MPVWTPADLGTKLYAWFDAGTIRGVADGADLSSWSDQSGNSRDLTGVSGSVPSYSSSNLGSRAAVVFDGSEGMHGPTSTPDPFDFESTDFNVVIVAKTDGNTATVGTILQNNSTSDGYSIYRVEIGGSFNFSVVKAGNNVIASNALLNATNGLLYGYEQISTAAKGYFNGTTALGGTPDTSVATGTPLQVGYAGTPSSITANTGFKGSISEIVFHTSNNTTDRQLVEGYLAHKYGLAGGLPSDHPYKSLLPLLNIPTITWTGGGNPTSIIDPDNWSDGLGPDANKRCIIADGADSITFDNLVCKELRVLEGFTGNIGTTSSALNVTADNVVIKAPLAQTYLDLDVDDTTYLEHAGLGCKLEGDSLNLHYSSPTKATLEMDSLSRVTVEGAGRLATLHLDKGLEINVGPYGSVQINGDVTTVNVSGGKVFCGDHVVNTFNINGGHVAFGGDTLTTLNIYAGEFDLGGNENTQVDITNLNLYGGFVDLQNAISAAEVTSLKTFGNGRVRLPLGTTTVS